MRRILFHKIKYFYMHVPLCQLKNVSGGQRHNAATPARQPRLLKIQLFRLADEPVGPGNYEYKIILNNQLMKDSVYLYAFQINFESCH